MHLAQNGEKLGVCCDSGDGFLVGYGVGSLVDTVASVTRLSVDTVASVTRLSVDTVVTVNKTVCGYSGSCNKSLLRVLRDANDSLGSANESHKNK